MINYFVVLSAAVQMYKFSYIHFQLFFTCTGSTDSREETKKHTKTKTTTLQTLHAGNANDPDDGDNCQRAERSRIPGNLWPLRVNRIYGGTLDLV